MKDTTIEKVRKTCGNCTLYDKRHKQCNKSEFFVNPTRGRPNCKNWALAKDVPTYAFPEMSEERRTTRLGEEKQATVPTEPASCQCHEHAKMPERDDTKEVLPERKTEEVGSTKENPIQHWLKKIGIVK